MDYDETLRILIQENSKSVSEEALRLLFKIVENILKDPSNIKLRTLQKNNLTVSKKIIAARGAIECLKVIGFKEEKFNYVLPTNLPLTNLEKCKERIIYWRKQNNTPNLMSVEDNSEKGKCEQNQSKTIIKKIDLPPLKLTYQNPFLRTIETYYHNVLQYENKGLQQRALKLVPLAMLEENAQKRLRNIQEHVKKNKLEDPEISIQDTLILELLNWFKEDFFSWVDSPECSSCNEITVFSHMSTDPSLLTYTNRVELHRCTACHKFTPFPRYNDLNILLETRKGRCGEWANTFTLFCRAMGWDSRYVVDEADHVWTEVYSVTQKRWLHCDSCENVCDTPLMYETGWKKQISYVIAYSAEEVQDVSWRYSSNHKEVLKRRKHCSEKELLNALMELRSRRKNQLSDARRKYLIKRLLNELVEFLTERKPNNDDHQGRSSGSTTWRLARGEVQNDIEEPLYIWNINNDDIIDNSITIRYSSALDRYEYLAGGKILRIIEKWNTGTFKCSGIFRKEEKDWKMVYLSRKEGSDCGMISWKVKLDCSKSIDTVSLDFQHTTYENGKIKVQMASENNNVSIENGIQNVKEFGGSRELVISASLSGGKGDVSWQHVQLFRQSSDSKDFPFSLRITFK